MAEKRKIEIFSAGCPVCGETVQMVNALACPFCDVQVLDMHREDERKRQKNMASTEFPPSLLTANSPIAVRMAESMQKRSKPGV